jgi:hypothetical protein
VDDISSNDYDRLVERYDDLMVGWASLAPRSGTETFAGGVVLVVAAAEDADDFRRQARASVEEAGYRLVDVERLRWLTAYAKVNLEVFPLAAEAVETGDAALGAVFLYEEEESAEEATEESAAWTDLRRDAALVKGRDRRIGA